MNQENQFLLARFNPDGTLDPTFGDQGRVIYEHAGAHTYAEAIETDAEGRIYVGGDFAPPGGRGQIGVVRFTADGVPDPEWGTDGVATAGAMGRVFTEDDNLAVDGESAGDHGRQQQGRPRGPLRTRRRARPELRLRRDRHDRLAHLPQLRRREWIRQGDRPWLRPQRADGDGVQPPERLGQARQVDRAEGDLLATFPDFLAIDARSVALDGESAVGTGFAYLKGPGDDTDYALARVSPNGKLDRGFGSDGKITFDRGKDDTIFDAAIAGDGTIFGAGYTSGADFAAIAVTPRASSTRVPARRAFCSRTRRSPSPAHGIAMHDGYVFLAGTARLGDTGDDVAVARFTP